ncbi:hypothetical protein ACIPY6_03055 [Streptomyces sp. NPDC090054]|uniref:hypothetical protein n=1 Tax=Streptomyces sp. NPDC090054 TaxID=3365933 RepID=UPI003822CFDD
MSGWAWAAIFTGVWIALSPLVGLALGYAIRRGDRTPTPRTAARHTPRWARTDHHQDRTPGRHRR